MDNIHRYAHLMSQRTLMLSGRPVDMHLLLSQQISNFFRLNLDEVLLKFEASVRVLLSLFFFFFFWLVFFFFFFFCVSVLVVCVCFIDFESCWCRAIPHRICVH